MRLLPRVLRLRGSWPRRGGWPPPCLPRRRHWAVCGHTARRRSFTARRGWPCPTSFRPHWWQPPGGRRPARGRRSAAWSWAESAPSWPWRTRTWRPSCCTRWLSRCGPFRAVAEGGINPPRRECRRPAPSAVPVRAANPQDRG
ncbi:hypothetical protein UK14_04710 [Streptomyces sp. NRRL F-4428]|nr:hypothetical protein UK14_04710 [Streptomyces sp. NRRL F-4428]